MHEYLYSFSQNWWSRSWSSSLLVKFFFTISMLFFVVVFVVVPCRVVFFLHKSLLLFFVASCLDRLVAVFGPVGSSASNDHRIASIYPTLVNIIHSWHSNSPKDPPDQLPLSLPGRNPHQPFLYTNTCFTAPRDDGRVKLVFCTI